MVVAAALIVPAIAQQPSAAPAPAAPKGVTRVLLDRSLKEHPVLLTAIDSKTLSYTEQGGLVRNESLDEFLAILLPDIDPVPTPADPKAPPPQVLELVDGQRLTGKLGAIPAAGSAPGETFTWEHPLLGAAPFKLDQVRALTLRPTDDTTEPPTGDSDRVTLANGDRLDGLIEGLLATPPSIRLTVSGSGRDIPFDRITEVRLRSNPAAPFPAGTVAAWLRDGSVIACRSLKTSRAGDLALEPAREGPPPAAPVPLADLIAVDLHPGSLVPLASLTPADQRPTSGRRWTRPVDIGDDDAPLGLEDVELPGPMIAEWELPARASRFAARAELPRALWNWGNAELTVSLVSGGQTTELFRQRLTADQPSAAINVPLTAPTPGARLRIRLDAGPYGPIQDRVVLNRAVLLIEPAH